MKIIEAIQIADKLISNAYDLETKINWLSAVDALLQRELVMRHEGGVERNTKYTVSDRETELIAESPYDELYIAWLKLKIHHYNGEIELYNNAAEEYNNLLYEYRKWYTRTHRDLPTPKMHSYGVKAQKVDTDLFNLAMQTANGYKGEMSEDVSAE